MTKHDLEQQWAILDRLLASIATPTTESKETIANIRESFSLLIAETQRQSIALQLKEAKIDRLQVEIGRLHATHAAAAKARRWVRSIDRQEPQLPRFLNSRLSSFHLGEK